MILMPVTSAPQLTRTNLSPSGPVPDAPGNCCVDIGTTSGTTLGGDPFAHATNSAPRVVHQQQGPITISKGVAEGMAISKPSPNYPAIARSAGLQGTVVLQATISKTGTIENLHVLSGPPMLQQAALNAVQQWRYRPYLLNGDPVEVETTINVIFSLGR
jgi:protein TonB